MFVCPFVKGSVGLSYVCRWAVFTGELIDCIRGIFSRGVDLVLVSMSMFRRVVGEEKVTLMSCFCRTCLRGWLREGW